MPEQLNAFAEQEHEQPDASRRDGRKIVFDDNSNNDVPTLPDGRFDGQREWSAHAIAKKQPAKRTHNEQALDLLYNEGRITRRMFADETDRVYGKPSFKLPARIADLRQIEDAPPIKTDEEKEPTEWYIPQADTD